MLTYGKCTDIAEQTPFLATLQKAAYEFKSAKLYVTGEYALCLMAHRPLPKSIEIRGTLSLGEMLALCDMKGYEYTAHGDDVLILADDKRFLYAGICGGSLRLDAQTRDFTMNAIYISISDGEVQDPQNALSDINSGILRTTVNPGDSFSAYPVRIMHMVRICCEYDYYVDDETLSAAQKFSEKLSAVSTDAIRNALFAILMSDTAKVYENRQVSGDNSPVLRGLMMLRNMNAFAYILPELEAGRGVEQKKRYHIYDVQGHMLHTCAATPPRLYMRVAGLLHDIGKPGAYILSQGKNMHGHDKIGAEMAREVLHRLHCKEDFINKVCRIIAIHMYDVAGIAKVDTLRKRFAQWGYRLTQDLIDFRMADVLGSGCPDRKSDSAVRFREIFELMKAENTPFSIHELKITGREIARILDLNSGAEINDIKRELLRICAVSPEYNEFDALSAMVRDMRDTGKAYSDSDLASE